MDRLVKITYVRPNGNEYSAVIKDSQLSCIKQNSNINITNIIIVPPETERSYILK